MLFPHMEAQLIVFATFFYIFFRVSLARNNLCLTFKDVHRFLYIYCYYKYTGKNGDDKIINLC